MQTLSQYLETARKDYTRAVVNIYKRDPDDLGLVIEQVSGDIDSVSNYFQKDPFGNHLILSGHFYPGHSCVKGKNVTCICS